MKHIKNLFHNQFVWYSIMAIMSIIVTGCYIYEDKDILAICWAIIAGCDIGMAWFNRDGKV